MKHLLYSSLLFLAACPTPPDSVPGATSGQNSGGTNGGGPNGGSPNGGPNGAGPGSNGGPNNGGQNGAGPIGGNNPGGAEGGGPNNEAGPKGGAGPNGAGGQNGSQNGSEGGQAQGEMNQENNAGADGAGNPQEKPPEGKGPGENSGPVEGAILIKVDQPPPTDQVPQYTQDSLASSDHVTLSGQATCGCSDNLIIRINKFLPPNSKPSKDDLITTKKVGGEGTFSIMVPKGESAIAIELLVDQNGDGLPSRGERFAVIEQGGKLIPSADLTDLSLDASDREPDNQAPE